MTTKKRRLTQAQTEARPRLRLLKKLGLFKGRVTRPTRHGVAQVKKFADVLAKRAAVVNIPKVKRGKGEPDPLKAYREAFRTRGRKVVVPKIAGEHAKFNPRTKRIETIRTQHGHKIRKSVIPVSDQTKLGDVPLGPGFWYVLPLGNNFHIREKTIGGLAAFVNEYEKKHHRTYREWQKYVSVEEILSGDDGEAFGERLKGKRKRA